MTSSNVSKELSEEISVRYPCLYGTYDIHSTTYFASRQPRVLSASRPGRPAACQSRGTRRLANSHLFFKQDDSPGKVRIRGVELE